MTLFRRRHSPLNHGLGGPTLANPAARAEVRAPITRDVHDGCRVDLTAMRYRAADFAPS